MCASEALKNWKTTAIKSLFICCCCCCSVGIKNENIKCDPKRVWVGRRWRVMQRQHQRLILNVCETRVNAFRSLCSSAAKASYHSICCVQFIVNISLSLRCRGSHTIFFMEFFAIYCFSGRKLICSIYATFGVRVCVCVLPALVFYAHCSVFC